MEGSSPTSTVQSTHEFKPNGLHLPNENLIEIFEQKTEGSGEFYENFQLQSTLLPEEITSSSLFTFSSPNLHEAESSNSFNFTEETTFHHTGHKLFASSSSDQSVFLSESNETDAPGASTTNVVEALEETTVNEYFSSESDKESNVKVSTSLYTSLDSSSESSLSTTEHEPWLTPESSTSEENTAVSTTEATEGVTATDQPTSTLQLHETESSEIGSFISSSYPPEPIEPETSAFTTSSVPAEHQSSISSSSSDELSNYFTTTDATDDSSVSALLSTAHSFDDISNGGLIGSSATSYSHPELSSNSPSTVKESVYISFSTLAPPIDSSTEISSLTSSTEGFDDLLSSTVHKESPISKHDLTDSWESTVQPYFESTTSSAMSTDEISSETGNQGSVTNLASTEDHSVHSLTTEESANGYTRYHTGPLNVNIKEEPTSTTGYSFHHGNGEFTDYETYASSDVSFSSEISSVTPARPSFGSEASSLFPFSSGTTGTIHFF